MTDWQARWSKLRPWLAIGFLLLAVWLLWRYAHAIDWHEVGTTLAGYRPSQLALAATASLLAYALYCGFDVLARSWTGHRLPLPRVLAIAFVCYAFNLNLGAMVGGIGFRYRLYSRAGLRMAEISRIVAFAIAGNWSGFVLLGGLLLLLDPVPPPADWDIARQAQRIAGVAMLAATAAWFALIAFSPRRDWTLRGHAIELPSLPVALLQIALSSASWLAIAAIMFVLMPAPASYVTVAGVLLWGVLANLVIRVPANLGVLEAVFLAMLGPRLGVPQVLAALLAYRALFHVGPLLLAFAVYLWLEARARRGTAIDPPARARDPG